MKQIFAILFLSHYIIMAIGVNVKVHYCDEKIASVLFGFDIKEKCACGSNSLKNNCCEDKEFSFKLEDDQHKSRNFKSYTIKSFVFQPAFTIICLIPFQPPVAANVLYNSHLPPNQSVETPLYILNEVFIL